MSVVRYSEVSDVYMWPEGRASFRCACGEPLLVGIPAAREHLLAHIRRGEKVPDHAFEDLDSRNPETGSRLTLEEFMERNL